MVARRFTPERGDVVWVDFSPQRGREQAKRRPALVLSPHAYNEKTHLMLVCPVTSQVKGYPFEACITLKHIEGAVLCDQIRTLDWHERKTTYGGRVSPALLQEVSEKIVALIAG